MAARNKRAGEQRARKRPRPPRADGSLTLALLSRKASLYTTRRMVEAGRGLGHEVLVLDTLRCECVVSPEGLSLVHGGREVRDVEAVLPRIGASITQFGLSVVSQLELMGVPVLNGSLAIARSRDKFRSLQLLARFGIDVPRTVLMRGSRDLPAAVARVGGLPAIVKLVTGTQGVGVMIAQTPDELASILSTMWSLDQEILLQEFIAESRGTDVRALVVGDRVVGAMRRVARVKGEFRSNIHRGGEGEAIELPLPVQELAVRAARVLGLQIAGVDMLEATGGPKIIEVNSSPGFEGLEAATGLDIARSIIEHVAAFARTHAHRPALPPPR